MTFEEILNQTLAMLQRQGRVSYRALKRQFSLDDAYIDDLKFEIIEVHRAAVDQDNTMLVWTGDQTSTSATSLCACRPSGTWAALLHPTAPRRENPHLSQCPGGRTQTGDGAVLRPG